MFFSVASSQVSVNYGALILSSAVVASLVSGVVAFVIASRNRRDIVRMRQEDASTIARDRFLPKVVAVHQWLDAEHGRVFGPDIGYHGGNHPVPELPDVSSVLRALNDVRFEHPDNAIRLRAERLGMHLDGHYNMTSGDPKCGEPTDTKILDWINQARNLVDAVRDGTEPLSRV